jgi:hypothetical protein
MARKKQSAVKFMWSDFSRGEQMKVVELMGNDGHTIYDTSRLIEAGLHPRIANTFSHTYKSDGSLKGSIESNGVYVDELNGIYGLDVLWSLARYFNEESDKMGRGFQARELTEKIRKHLGVEDN